uniref:Reverse transcriptase domain-containing protein n=1 Tax=Tanacetum cinerariifolium TaxID=118510 RepID=A0A6L2P0E2_TANCI|nr:reverse transcriptase domain-containing protein [Tanacetum cinerariifolium]
MPTATRIEMTLVTIEEMIKRRVAEALKYYKANQNHRPIMESGTNMKMIMEMATKMVMRMDWVEEMEMETSMFQEMVPLCTKMVPKDEDRVEKFICDLPDNIQGNVIFAEPLRLQDAVRIAKNLMDQKLKGYAVRNAENKRRFGNNSRDNRVQQPPLKIQNGNGQNVARAYIVRNSKKRGYVGPLPYCNKYKLHHDGKCTVHFFLIIVMRVDRSFVLTTFSALLDVVPSTLDVSYAIELVDERILKTDIIHRGCTLGLLGHPFDIDLIPVELGSFNIIIGMD